MTSRDTEPTLREIAERHGIDLSKIKDSNPHPPGPYLDDIMGPWWEMTFSSTNQSTKGQRDGGNRGP